MFRKLFHSDIFIPKGVEDTCKEFQKSFSTYTLSHHFEEHIKNQQIEDRSHTYLRDVITQCLSTLKTTQRDVFEVELSKGYYEFGKSGWFVTKYCVRIPYNDEQDLCVVIRPQWIQGTARIKSNLVVTAWMNAKSDSHFTLDETKYCDKKEWLDINFNK